MFHRRIGYPLAALVVAMLPACRSRPPESPYPRGIIQGGACQRLLECCALLDARPSLSHLHSGCTVAQGHQTIPTSEAGERERTLDNACRTNLHSFAGVPEVANTPNLSAACSLPP